MSSVKLLKLLNPVMFLAFLTAAVGVVLLKYPIIPSLQGSEIIYNVHVIAGQIFIVLGILHLVLNWSWIKSQIFGIKPKSKIKKKK